jgi:YD repeat-containing protein
VDGATKIGNFTLSFPDASLPNQGFPITVTRTYDSRTKDTPGDFGYGWGLSTTNITVEASSVLGKGFIQTETQLAASSLNPLGGIGGGLLGGLPGLGLPGLGGRQARIQYSFENTLNDLVTIFLPDGSKEQFIMGFYGVSYNFAGPPLASTTLFFVPLAGTGTTGTLEALTNNNVIVSPAQVGPVTFIDASTGQVYNPTRWKYTDQAGTVFIISTANGVESITDPNGHTETFSSSGITSSDGRDLTYSRDAQGRITTITQPDGSQLHYGYDFYGDLATVTDAAGNVTRFTYDTDHLLENVYDPLGRQGARNEYDNSGRLIAEVDAQGHMISFDHALPQNIETKTDALGNKTTYVYDDQGNVTEQIDPLGNVTQSTYDGQHHVLSQTEILADGTRLTTSYTYDAAGHKTSVTDPMGATTSYTYDAHGNLLSTKDQLGLSTTNTYDANGNLLTSTDPNGNTTTNVVDSAGQVLKTTDPMGYTILSGYNQYGETVTSQDQAGTNYSATYDFLGRPTSDGFVWVDPTNPNHTQNLQEQKTYDANGNATTVVAPNGTVTQSRYDAAGNLVAATDRLGNWTSFIYDTSNRQIETLYADGTVVLEVYDALGRPIYTTDRYDSSTGKLPDGTHTIYNAAGLVVETDRLSQVSIGVTTTAAGNRSSRFVSAGSVLSRTTNTYDAAGRVVQSTDPSGVVTKYTYDLDGRPLTTTVGSATTSDQYDADGRRTQETDPSGATTQYVYDADNNVIKTIYADGTTTESTYDQDNRVTSSTDQAGQTTNYQYDAMDHLTAVILPAVPDPQNGGKLTRPEYDYTYDVYGDVLTKRDPLGHVTTYTYDAFGQQLSESTPDGETASLTYTATGLVASSTDFKGQVTTNWVQPV